MSGYLIAMSGGVDSSAAASLILERHGDAPVCGVTLVMGFDGDKQNSLDAASVAGRLGIGHVTSDCSEAFRREVIDYFAHTYFRGKTPNPCVICNRAIKFGFLASEADKLGLYHIVTGHYARTAVLNGRPVIRKAADSAKDQSYVLAMLTKAQVARAVFPLGDYTKTEVRTIASEQGFATAGKHDSQDICFIPDGDYVGFISRTFGVEPVSGNYLDKDGNILGPHKGQMCYTIGQRKGLGISMGRHIFVLSKDAESNTVVLGDEEDLFCKSVSLGGFNCQAADCVSDLDGLRFAVKLRYSQKESEAVVHAVGEDSMILEFDEPQRAPSPGQFGVLYSGDILIGGGVIEARGKNE
ncbi:MAG: tRNA 2-thiouridine(34) synthase MnmA [Ruminococcaceae bacterium]|nr:tRNA 2-thiouridine(34) synthase MnmA [Oscillospiraceae bacterium]